MTRATRILLDKELGAVGSGVGTPRRIVDYLATRDHPCPKCGYNLRGTAGSRCPECGNTRLWHEPLPERGWRFGLACMTVAYFLVALLAAASTLKGHIFIGLVAGLTIFSAPDSLRRWARTRRAFGRLPIHIRQQLVAKWVLIAALASAFLLLVLRKGE